MHAAKICVRLVLNKISRFAFRHYFMTREKIIAGFGALIRPIR